MLRLVQSRARDAETVLNAAAAETGLQTVDGSTN
jgi:hypothetical protein